ncbi:ras guanine nucleotide exchange factor domain-containing protein [Cladochytrium replicatum]|nr:ras guanine nucleotide exchange factor domain-containing protein [Cladochytrium replicatum]
MPALLDLLTQMRGLSHVVLVGTGRPVSENPSRPRQVELKFGSKLASVFHVAFREVNAVEAPRTAKDLDACDVIRELLEQPHQFSSPEIHTSEQVTGAKLQLRELKRDRQTGNRENRKSYVYHHTDAGFGISESTATVTNGYGERAMSLDLQDSTLVYPMPNIGLLSEEHVELLMAGGEFALMDFSAEDTLPRAPSLASTEPASPTHSTPPSLSSSPSNTLKHLSSSTTASISAPLNGHQTRHAPNNRISTIGRLGPHMLSANGAKRMSRRLDIMDLGSDDFGTDVLLEEYGNANGTLSTSASTMVHRGNSTQVVPGSEAGEEMRRNFSKISDRSSGSSQPTTASVGFTVDELVERLTSPDAHDMEFTKAFLMLYRKFMRPSELLDRLMDRFDAYIVKDPSAHQKGCVIPPVQIRVCNVIIHWLTDYWCDLHTEKMRFTLHVFLQICMSRPSFAQIYNRLAPLVFRDPPTEEEKLSVDWGIPDPEDDPAEVMSTMSEDESMILQSVRDSTHAEVGTVSGTNHSVHMEDGVVPRQSVADAWAFWGEDGSSRPGSGSTRSGRVTSLSSGSYLDGRKMSMGDMSEDDMDTRSPGGPKSRLSNQLGTPSPQSTPNSTINRSISDIDDEEMCAFGSTLVGAHGVYQHQSQGRRWITNVFGMNREVDAGSMTGSGTNSPATPMSTGLPMMTTVPASVANATSFLNTPFLELDNYVIAQQLNLMEFEIFSRIKPRDFLQHIWSRRLKGRHAPAVAASIGHFNFISAWVATRVLSQKKLKSRSKMLSKFMKIAQILREANNYNTLMAIIAGINSHPVFRLKQTRRLIENKASFKQYEVLQDLMGMHHGFGNYRAALKASEMPCIPYLGLFLKDLLYTDEVNKDRKPDGTINLPKFLLMGDIIMMVKSFQVRPYHITKEPYIYALILNQPVMDDETAYERSLELEPKNRDSRDQN